MPRPLSFAEYQFLDEKGISTRWVYSRERGMTEANCVAKMRQIDRYILHGFSPCDVCKLSLLYRSNLKCLKCYHKQLEHLDRFTRPGLVYILTSKALAGFVKLGCTQQTAEERARELREGHAGVFDWQVFYSVRAKRRGLLEERFKEEMQAYRRPVWYRNRFKEKTAQEIYRCDKFLAMAVLQKVRRDYLRRHLANSQKLSG